MQSAARPRKILLPRRTLISFVVFLLLAFLSIPALADHIGPHRTVSSTEWERLACHYEAVYDPAGPGWFGCTLDLYEPPDGTCTSTSSVADFFNPASCSGWPGSCTTLPCDISRTQSIGSCSEGESGCQEVAKTVTLPPATVSGSVTCAVPGAGGWCLGGAQLSLSGSEPLAGYMILFLEGTRNGEPFACSGAACAVPLLEGENAFTFWARSSYGDTSSMGSAEGRLDSLGPEVSIPDSWFIWEPVAIQVDDAGVGVDWVGLTIDGGEFGLREYSWGNLSLVPQDFVWDRHLGEIVAPIGEYLVTLEAIDWLGNASNASGTIIIPDPEVDSAPLGTTKLLGSEPVVTSGSDESSLDRRLQSELLESAQSERGLSGDSILESGTSRPGDSGVASDRGATAIQSDGSAGISSQPEAASLPGASVEAKVATTNVHWGQAALALVGAAAGYGTTRRAWRQAGERISFLSSPPSVEIPITSQSVPIGETEPDAVQDFLEWLKTRAEGASGIVDSVIALTRDMDSGPSALNALMRLLRPETSPNPTYTQILMNDLLEAARRGDFVGRADDLAREIENLAPIRRAPSSINYTDLKQFVSGLGRGEVVSGAGDLLSVALILAAERAMVNDPELGTFLRRLGGSVGATSDLWTGGRLLVNEAKFAEYFKLTGSRLGALTSVFGLAVGGLQWGSGVLRLLFDPSISDMKSNERWGVFGQALGGGLLFVGSLAGLLIAGSLVTGTIAASLTVLVPVGLVLIGAGFLVENWDWIGEGLSAWGGVFDNAGTIARALPDYVNETVVKPIVREVNERVVEPVSEGLRAWGGVLDNGRRIVAALPSYLTETVVEPALDFVNDRVIEPVRNGLRAWSGVTQNGERIIRALPDYVSETIVRPAVQAVQDNIITPVSIAVNERIIQPAQDFIDRRIIQPANSFRTHVVEPVRRVLHDTVVQPISNTISSGISALRGLFGGH